MTNPLARLERARLLLRGHDAESGWTLIELLVVLSLIMILTSIGMTGYRNSVLTAKEATLKSNLFIMRDAIDQYYADKAQYPDSLGTLVAENYLRAIPEDPITDSTSTWQAARDAPSSGNQPSGGPRSTAGRPAAGQACVAVSTSARSAAARSVCSQG